MDCCFDSAIAAEGIWSSAEHRISTKLFRTVTSDVYLSDPAIWQRYRDEHEVVKVDLAAIVPRNAVPDSAVTVSPPEVEAWYQAHFRCKK